MKKQQDPDLLNISGSRESIVNVFNASLKKQQDADHLTISNSEGEVISPVKMKENFKQIEKKYKKQGVEFTVATDTSIPTIESNTEQ